MVYEGLEDLRILMCMGMLYCSRLVSDIREIRAGQGWHEVEDRAVFFRNRGSISSSPRFKIIP
jgi:hypothetical protein